MVVGWAPWWTGQTERTTLLTVGALAERWGRSISNLGEMVLLVCLAKAVAQLQI